MKKIIYLIFIIILLVLFFMLFTESPEIKETLTNQNRPDIVFYDLELAEIHLGEKIWQINTEKAVLENETIRFIEPLIKLYKTKKVDIEIKTKIAYLFTKTRNILMQKAKAVFISNKANLIADKITWLHSLSLIKAEGNILFNSQRWQVNSNALDFYLLSEKIILPNPASFQSKEIEIKANNSTYELKTEQLSLQGANVKTKDNLFFKADNIIANPKDIKAIANVEFNQNKKGLLIKGRAGEILYKQQNKQLFIEKNVFLESNRNINIASDKMFYDFNKLEIKDKLIINYKGIEIKANNAIVRLDDNYAELIGNCQLKSGNNIIKSQKMIIENNTVYAKGQVELKAKDMSANSKEARYFIDSKKMVLKGDSTVLKGNDMISAPLISIMLTDQKIITERIAENSTQNTVLKIDPAILFSK